MNDEWNALPKLHRKKTKRMEKKKKPKEERIAEGKATLLYDVPKFSNRGRYYTFFFHPINKENNIVLGGA